MQFEHSYILFFIIPALMLLAKVIFGKKNIKTILYPFKNREIFEKQKNNPFLVKIITYCIYATAISCLLIALANPQNSSTKTRRSAQGIDIMIALDISGSMAIEDYDGKSRLEVAKATVEEFVKGRSDDRIGFLIFSGESITLVPPTLDYEFLEKAIQNVEIKGLKDGTAIGDAIAMAVARLKDSTAKSKVIILLTDGDNNMGSVAPLTAGSLAVGYGIKVYSIALGTEGQVPLPVVEEDIFGRRHKQYTMVDSTINPELLQKISAATNGKFYRAQEKNTLENVFHEINSLEKTKIETKQKIQWNTIYQKPLLFGFLLLIIGFILTKTKLRILPN